MARRAWKEPFWGHPCFKDAQQVSISLEANRQSNQLHCHPPRKEQTEHSANVATTCPAYLLLNAPDISTSNLYMAWSLSVSWIASNAMQSKARSYRTGTAFIPWSSPTPARFAIWGSSTTWCTLASREPSPCNNSIQDVCQLLCLIFSIEILLIPG